MCSKASAAVTVGSGSFLSSSSSSLSLLHCAGITSCTMSSNESSRQTHIVVKTSIFRHLGVQIMCFKARKHDASELFLTLDVVLVIIASLEAHNVNAVFR
uniref:Putative secreted protein n=1 Tax=Ixodes ricinus TaxID=34613 RepID=A0A6B0UFU0_IXORI